MLKDLKLSKSEQKEEVAPQQPEYPYGTVLYLDTEALKKLGIKDLPNVGDEYHIRAVGCVTRVSSSASESNEQQGMDIQIKAMELTNEGPYDGDSVAEEEAEDAERSAVGGRTVLANAYRGRR